MVAQNLFLFCVGFKNNLLINKKYIFKKNKKFYQLILNILWDNGYILCYKVYKKTLKVFIKYLNFKPVFNLIKPILKSNKIMYFSLTQIFNLKKNIFYIFLTNYGLKSLLDCKNLNIGGKLLIIII